MSIFWKTEFLKFDRFGRFMGGNNRVQFAQLSVLKLIDDLFMKVSSKIITILQEVGVLQAVSHLVYPAPTQLS